MKIDQDEIVSILSKFNPWWTDKPISDLPNWKRAAYGELYHWITQPEVPRAIMLSGARQIGKTTLLMQVIDELRDSTPAANILYATFDHPILKLAGIDAVLDTWRTRVPKQPGKEYIFLDEAQFIRDWGTWVKHQVDFNKGRQIVFTCSALPLVKEDQESGVGRWHTIKLTTLSFYEYVRITKLQLSPLPKIQSLQELFQWDSVQLLKIQERARDYVSHFHQYLIRGGFPQTALATSITHTQRLLREDIIDKALKRDMTALFGVRRVLDLEQTFLYLCLHDGGILDMQELCKNLEIKRPTAQNFIDLLESTHLIYRLAPFGYGKEVLRGKFKVYLSDPSIAPAVLLKDQSIIENPRELGVLAESSVLKHLVARYYKQNVKFSYWRKQDRYEVDLLAELNNQIIPFEVKYRTTFPLSDLDSLYRFCAENSIERGYVVTQSPHDIGRLPDNKKCTTPIIRIPAALLCYWMGEMEIQHIQGEPLSD